MKKALRIYLCAWAVLIVAIALYILLPSHHSLASKPDNIEKILKLDLPDIAEVESTNNLDRGASRWDWYEHSIRFEQEISDECIAELKLRCLRDSKHWTMNEKSGPYIYSDEGGIDELYSIFCEIHKDRAVLSYEVSEDEGIFAILGIMFLFVILTIWGLVLAIVAIARRKSR